MGVKGPPSRANDGPRAKGLRGTGVRLTITLRGVPMLTALGGREGMPKGVRLGARLSRAGVTTTALRPGWGPSQLLALLLLPREEARRFLRSATQPTAAATATAAATPTTMPAMAAPDTPPPPPLGAAAAAAAGLPGPLQHAVQESLSGLEAACTTCHQREAKLMRGAHVLYMRYTCAVQR